MKQPYLIANFFIQKSFDSGTELTPMKLIKLIYIAHGWHLGLTGEPLISEGVFAWPYGPVIPSVYRNFKHYGKGQINSYYIPPDQRENTEQDILLHPPAEDELIYFLNKVWEVYSKFDGIQLSTLTHQPGTPWDLAWKNRPSDGREEVLIPNDEIKKHYREKLERNKVGEISN